MLRGSPGSHFTSGSNRFRSGAGAVADLRVMRCACPCRPRCCDDGHGQIFEQSTTCGSFSSDLGLARTQRGEPSRGEFVKIRRAYWPLQAAQARR
jgi:hypothetical protein